MKMDGTHLSDSYLDVRWRGLIRHVGGEGGGHAASCVILGEADPRASLGGSFKCLAMLIV